MPFPVPCKGSRMLLALAFCFDLLFGVFAGLFVGRIGRERAYWSGFDDGVNARKDALREHSKRHRPQKPIPG